MTTYSYSKCTDIRLGATVYENDVPILVTKYNEGYEVSDHDDLAEHICSTLTLITAGKERLSSYDRSLDKVSECV